MIDVKNLSRHYRVYQKKPGFLGAVKGLFHRDYETVKAANEITFSIAEGECVGFLGPNGAGKTTVMKMLSGLIHPTSGFVRVAGYEPRKRENAYRSLFSLVMGQKNQLWWDLPAMESFQLIRYIYNIPRVQYEQKLDELLTLLRVSHRVNVMVRELSLGERMKMELIASLLYEPKILFLDEPTIGLDVVSQRIMRNFIREYNERHKVTLLLTSHYMRDIEDLCDRVILIDKGKKKYDGRLSELQRYHAAEKLVYFQTDQRESFIREALSGVQLTELSKREGDLFRIRVEKKHTRGLFSRMLEMGVEDIRIEDIPLEDIMHAYFEEGVA